MQIVTKLCLTSIACLLTSCNSKQTTEAIPATAIEATPAADSPNPVPMAKLEKPKKAPPTATNTSETKSLAIGDDAPSASIDHWVKGAAVEDFEDGQVYVMEFWATWCGPCISSMPHISALQEEYGEQVKFIGVSSEKELETVTTFLGETNKTDNLLNTDRMRYTVAVDPDRSTSKAFMEAAGQNGIPTAFIINEEGKVAWIGHPMTMDKPLSEIVSGTWDIASAAAAFKQEQAQELAMREFNMTLRKSQQNGDWDAYIIAIDSFTDEFGPNPQLMNMKFRALLEGKQDKLAAYACAEDIVQSNWNDAMAMNAMAWGIVDEMPEESQDLDFALKVAMRGCELTDYKDPMILDTLARCYWEMGDHYKAIAWQKKAVANPTGTEMDESIQATLDDYQTSLANVDE